MAERRCSGGARAHRLERGVRDCGAAALLAGVLAGCALGDSAGPWGMTETRHFAFEPGGLPELGAGEALELMLPLGTDRNQFALVAKEQLVVGDGAEITEPRFSRSVWGAPLAAFGGLHVGRDARVGSIYGLGRSPVVLEPGAAVSGFVKSSTGVDKAKGAFIRQGVVDDTPPAVEAFRWHAQPSGAEREKPEGSPHGAVMLLPGIYEEILVGPDETAQLTRGRYYVERLQVQEGATLTIDNASGPVYVWVSSSLEVLGTVSRLAEEHNVLWGLESARAPRIVSAFAGVLVAPRAEVRLPATEQPHRGSFFARSISVEPRAAVEHWGFFLGSGR